MKRTVLITSSVVNQKDTFMQGVIIRITFFCRDLLTTSHRMKVVLKP